MRADAALDNAVNRCGAYTPKNQSCPVRCEIYLFQMEQRKFPKSAGGLRAIYGPKICNYYFDSVHNYYSYG